MLGRAWDDQITLGMNPLKDPVMRQQIGQALAPRALYRVGEAMTSDMLTSAASGDPMIQKLGPMARFWDALGFQPTQVALQYDIYEHMLENKQEMTQKLALFGDAYAHAMTAGDSQTMGALLRQSMIEGLDVNDVMHSAQRHLRNQGLDMFGRQFNQEQRDQYQQSLAIARQ
jgi:hypothetical protein